jgi:hypothetical protein
MSTNFSEKERAFVDGLGAETGRDLATWLTAITTSGHLHRNDIIDWLRQQGFTFSRASWLERIHHNGGKLIYADRGARAVPIANRKKPVDAPPPSRAPVTVKVPPPSVAGAMPTPAPVDQDIDDLLLAAKAYRPLAQVLLRDALAAVPGAETSTTKGLIVLSHARPFAAIAPSPKDIRLYLPLAGPSAAGWQKAKQPAGLDSSAVLTHVVVLTDARQLTRELRDLIVASAHATEADSSND